MTRYLSHISAAALILASLLLAIEPAQWLLRSWQDPAYQSVGWVYALALLGLMVASVRSGPAGTPRLSAGLAVLFLLAALLRLAGQMMAINILAALALAVDVYAIARCLRLEARPLALAPFWLAVFFLFALPLAPILERVLGFPLQMLSAQLSCAMLWPFFAGLECDGVRLVVNTVDVMVDLPCAGASGLLLMLALWTGLNARLRPSLIAAFLALIAVLILAVMGNALRISLLAAGLAHGIDTMAPRLHDAIGLAALGMSALPILLLYRPKPQPPRPLPQDIALSPAWRLGGAGLAILISLAIITAPKTPLDRSPNLARLDMPSQLLGHPAQPMPLSEVERYYFTAYGGHAQKAHYGPLGLNMVQTGSPLRHLHSPATCLRGMGFEVRFLGTTFDPSPSSVYQATDPHGRAWIVAVSFVSDQGDVTASVAEAVWSWLSGQSHQWMSVQRITPLTMPAHERNDYDRAVLAALDQ